MKFNKIQVSCHQIQIVHIILHDMNSLKLYMYTITEMYIYNISMESRPFFQFIENKWKEKLKQVCKLLKGFLKFSR